MPGESHQEQTKGGGTCAGGKAFREKCVKKRLLSEICNQIGALKSDSELLEHLGLDADERTKDAAVVTAMYMAAEAGDSKAAAWIRDTKGESKIQVDVAPVLPIDTSDLYFNEDDEQPDSLLP